MALAGTSPGMGAAGSVEEKSAPGKEACYRGQVRFAAARLTVAVVALASLALPALGALASCGTSAAGIEACRQIEAARCEAMQACGLSADEAASCSSFYHDQCLHGVEDPTANPDTSTIDACVAAVNAAGACARGGAANMAACPAAPLVPSANATALTPCAVISQNAHLLVACAFVVKDEAPPPASTSDAGSDATSDAASDAPTD